jgi:hypothetical protein
LASAPGRSRSRMTSTRRFRKRSCEDSRGNEAAPRHARILLVHHRRPKTPGRFPGGQPRPGQRSLSERCLGWETVIKYHLGKLPLPAPPADYLPSQRNAHRILSLPIDEGAISHLADLPPLHRDPFDRLLIAQALQQGLTLATVDPEIAAYPVSILPSI